MGAFRVFGRSFKLMWEDLLPLVLMNIVASGCSLLVLPGPAAWAALHHVCHRAAHGFAINWDDFWGAFKAHWRTWTPFTALAVIINLLIVFNFTAYPGMFPNQTWVPFVQGAWLSVLIIWNAMLFYAFPMWVEQEVKQWRIALKNGIVLAGANPLFTILLMLFTLFFLVLVTLLLPPVIVLFGLVFVTMVANAAAADRMLAYRKRLGLPDPYSDAALEAAIKNKPDGAELG
jgi:uncharacterized membrane protein YesL